MKFFNTLILVIIFTLIYVLYVYQLRKYLLRGSKSCLLSIRKFKKCFAFLDSVKKYEWIFISVLSFIYFYLIDYFLGTKSPRITDEFGYLLNAEIFATGHLSNPSPLFPKHFDALYQLIAPSRVSKYPFGQTFILYIGIIFFKKAAIGTALLLSVFCGLLYRFLNRFCSRLPCFVSLIIFISNPLILEWSQSYWGGGVFMMGGLLFIDCLLGQKGDSLQYLQFSISIICMLSSRPVESVILLLLNFHLIYKYLSLGKFPLNKFFTLSPILVFMLFSLVYNRQTTGSFTKLPYVYYSQLHTASPAFLFMKEVKTLDSVDVSDLRTFKSKTTDFSTSCLWFLKHMWIQFSYLRYDIISIISFFIGIFIIFIRKENDRFVGADISTIKAFTLSLFVFQIVVACEVFQWPHYTSCLIPFYLLLITIGLNRFLCSMNKGHVIYPVVLRDPESGSSVGKVLVTRELLGAHQQGELHDQNKRDHKNIIFIFTFIFLYFQINGYRKTNQDFFNFSNVRDAFIANLDSKYDYLIFISQNKSLVYNKPDIFKSKFIFANDLGSTENKKLIDYCKERHVIYIPSDVDGFPVFSRNLYSPK